MQTTIMIRVYAEVPKKKSKEINIDCINWAMLNVLKIKYVKHQNILILK